MCLTIFIISSSLYFVNDFKKWALFKSFSIYCINNSGPDILGWKFMLVAKKAKKSAGVLFWASFGLTSKIVTKGLINK